MIIVRSQSSPRLLGDVTVSGLDVNMALFLLGLAGAGAVIASMLAVKPRTLRVRAKYRF